MRLTLGVIATSLLMLAPAAAVETGWTDAQDVAAIHIDQGQRDQLQSLYWGHTDMAPLDQSNTDLVAARVGTAQGGIELFRYHLDSVPNTYTDDLRSKEYGAGLKLHITW